MLHSLVVGVSISPDVAIMLQSPLDAVTGRMPDQTG